jgi:phospholipid/cholesterol/gamma-HCH transport system substrate-binding protein
MKISKEAKIGAFVIAILVLFIWGINFLKGKDIFKRTNDYYMVFGNVAGLKVSNPVLISGFKVGTVHDIYMTDNRSGKVVVQISIHKGVKIPVKSIAQLSSDLLGTRSIKLKLSGLPTYHKPNDTLQSAIETDLMEQLMPLKNKVESAVVSIDSMIHLTFRIFDDKTIRSFHNSVEHVETFSQGLSDQKPRIDTMMRNLTSISDNLKKNNSKLTNILGNFSSISDSLAKSNLKQTLFQTQLAVTQMHLMLDRINHGEGTLGLLAKNDSLYNNLASASKGLDLLLKDLKENPKRYVHFSVFGQKDKTEKKK